MPFWGVPKEVPKAKDEAGTIFTPFLFDEKRSRKLAEQAAASAHRVEELQMQLVSADDLAKSMAGRLGSKKKVTGAEAKGGVDHGHSRGGPKKNLKAQSEQYKSLRFFRHCVQCNKAHAPPKLKAEALAALAAAEKKPHRAVSSDDDDDDGEELDESKRAGSCLVCDSEWWVCTCPLGDPGDPCQLCGGKLQAGRPPKMIHCEVCQKTHLASITHEPTYEWSKHHVGGNHCGLTPPSSARCEAEAEALAKNADGTRASAAGFVFGAAVSGRETNTLSAVLGTAIACIKRRMRQPALIDTLFTGPMDKMRDEFYPAAVKAEDAAYFDAKAEADEHRHVAAPVGWMKRLWHERRHPTDTKGYVFDREYANAKERKRQAVRDKGPTDGGGQPSIAHLPIAGESMHSKLGWRAVHEPHKVPDYTGGPDRMREAVIEAAEASQAIEKQSAWVQMQAQSLQHQRQRFEHLLHVVQSEQAKEIQRSVDELEAGRLPEGQRDSALARVTRERQETADWVIRILTKYDMLSGMEAASYLTSTVKNINARLKPGVLTGPAAAAAAAEAVGVGGSSSRARRRDGRRRKGPGANGPLTDEELLAQMRKRASSAHRRSGGGSGKHTSTRGGSAPGKKKKPDSHKVPPPQSSQSQRSNWDKVRDSVKAKSMSKHVVDKWQATTTDANPIPAIEQWRRRKAKSTSDSDAGSLLGTQILERLDKLDAEDALKVPDGAAWDGGRLADGRKPLVQLTGKHGGVSTADRAYSYIVNQPFSMITDHRFIGAASPAHKQPVKPLPPPPSRTTTPRQLTSTLNASSMHSPAALAKSGRRAHTLALAGSKSLDRVLYKKLCG